MNAFVHLPEMQPPEKAGKPWIVCEDWCTPVVRKLRAIIRAGFTSDGATIPRIAWTLIGHPMEVPMLGCALGHDALYAGELVSRSEADDWLLDAMEMAGLGWAKRNAVWLAVRAGGWRVWNKHTRQSITKARKFVSLV